MTAASAQARPAASGGVPGLPQTIASEFTKYSTLRASKVNLFFAVFVCAAVAAVVSSTLSVTRTEPVDSIPAVDVFTVPLLGLDAAGIVLLIGAAAFFGAEFTKRQGTVTFAVTPRRVRVLVAKVVVTVAVGIVVGIVDAIVAVSLGRAIGAHTGAQQLPLSDPAAVRLLLTTPFQPVYYAVLVGLFAVALRSSAGAIGLGFVVMLVAPAIAGALPGQIAQVVAPLLPRAGFDTLAGVAKIGAPEHVPVWWALLMMAGWLVVAWLLAVRRLRSHDV
ncbi:Putative integral membrane protein OS=Tsukamurella paurometabola (strain ATCC 8368 / DSM / CCUG 35730 / CIP 100753 / JCM 10117 / KCTC 9821 / NBRC 16120/ NCIMB 702349 / NCTC 13040) OX=521096 GN=Tpau_3489 PE=4 SV=1 [Tsukamurella paurometabola]|uniref:Putative integral membrane protein n=1 Tax=Tsukamurella paurometabola (strain ATCC 8368 / DSM 20162 / CCUG 35730 / CIP 100753 / JCM 10117 / KCTC 9821 / NBRC 16120 / NCIMB 702349 / NCTC 13040) TaxID=521096 RepID=D5UX49_TSUPD|nr:integral membrane protein [Tsukamurella paurometabola]ADG80068.1 putative integral membrane protein [Tsukamurella paurometabola DSM 20162]SUP38296.1 ABC-2 family transporter protein [Tsukamurella paurometabola]